MIARSIMFAVAGIVCASPATAQSVAPRSVVPIREVVISNGGDVRYAITMAVNGVPFEVGLDTGSIGLRLLPRAVRNARVEAGEHLLFSDVPMLDSACHGSQLSGANHQDPALPT